MGLKVAIYNDLSIAGNLGFFLGDNLHTELKADRTVELVNSKIPPNFDKDIYVVVEVSDKYKLGKKSQRDIDSIMKSRKEKVKPPSFDDMMALDAATYGDPMKTIIKYLQGNRG